MREFHLPVDENTIVQVSPGIEGGMEVIDRLEKESCKYTALVTSEDLIAAGVIKRLRDIKKRVPQDVAVFGFNNSIISLCTYPELSSVDNKVENMAQEAVKILYDVLNEKEVDKKKVVIPELIFRNSC